MLDETKRLVRRAWMEEFKLESEPYLMNNWIYKGNIPEKHQKQAWNIAHRALRKQWEETGKLVES